MIVIVKTHRPMQTLRIDLLNACCESVHDAFPSATRVLLVNDGLSLRHRPPIREIARTWDMQLLQPNPSPWDPKLLACDPGAGALVAGDIAHALHEDIVVWSDDDMVWRAGAGGDLGRMWKGAPPELVLVSGYLEPDYPWSKPIRMIECGESRVLLRPNAPGCALSFRADDWTGPEGRVWLRDFVEPTFGFDHKLCKSLLAGAVSRGPDPWDTRFGTSPESFKGRYVTFPPLIGQLDLAEHAGAHFSTHDNTAPATTLPIDKKRWGLL